MIEEESGQLAEEKTTASGVQLAAELEQSVGERTKAEYTPWDDFGVEEYVTRNYGERLLDEDRLIIQEATKALKESGIPLHSLHHVADVGAGPNFYPAMLLAPYVQKGGSIDLIEYSSANRSYAETVIDGSDGYGPLAGIWDKFETAMTQEGAQWQQALSEARSKAHVKGGSIFELPQNEFDAVSSYFVSESITDNREEFEQAVRSLVAAVKPGGFIMVAHILGSEGYPAGENTHFPAVSVTAKDLEVLYRDIADVKVIQVGAAPEARQGYHGMAIAVGRRKLEGQS